jgi:hypothetical protein
MLGKSPFEALNGRSAVRNRIDTFARMQRVDKSFTFPEIARIWTQLLDGD